MLIAGIQDSGVDGITSPKQPGVLADIKRKAHKTALRYPEDKIGDGHWFKRV